MCSTVSNYLVVKFLLYSMVKINLLLGLWQLVNWFTLGLLHYWIYLDLWHSFESLLHTLLSILPTFETFPYIWVINIHLGMLHTFGSLTYIWVCYIHLGHWHTSGYATYIWVINIHLGMLHTFGSLTYIWVCYIHLGH